MQPDRIVLHMFPASHFNEKARWALDWKAVKHRRIAYLPGPHVPQIRRLSGQAQTPVLVLGDDVIAGSAQIIDALERAVPERPLYPAAPELRARALEHQRHCDEEVGPAVRTAVFSVLIDEPAFLGAIFAGRQPLAKRVLYRALLPLAKPMIAKGNGVDPANVARAIARTERALDETERLVAATGQIIGDAFSVADLATAALLAPLANPSHPDMARPTPVPARMAELYARFEKHPALDWVRDQYARHRPPSHAA